MGLFNMQYQQKKKPKLGMFDLANRPQAMLEMPPELQSKAPMEAPAKPPIDMGEGTSPLENPEPKKDMGSKLKGMLSKVMESFKAKNTGGEADELGIPTPMKEERGIGRKIMDYGIPSLLGAATGVGVLPGIISAMKNASGRRKDEREDVQKYGKARSDRMEDMSDEDLAKAKQASTDQYNKERIKIGWAKANKGDKDNKVTKDDRKTSYLSLPLADRMRLDEADEEKLIEIMNDPDPDIANAARYKYDALGL